MGTPEFAVPCLEMLLTTEYEVVAVVTQPDRPSGRGRKLRFSPIKQVAVTHNLPVLQPNSVKDPAFYTALCELMPDVIVVVAYGQILPTNILSLPTRGCINVHASLLPAYRGAAPIHWAIINGETVTGITTMYMDVGMDTGDMILKAEQPIDLKMNTGMLHDQLMILGASLLKDTLSLVETGQAPRTPQDSTSATYAPLLTRQLERIDWHCTADDIYNKIRGLSPWPGAYCVFNNKVFKIHEAQLYSTDSSPCMPGVIQAITAMGIVVATGKGSIELLKLQPECRQQMNARDCVNGYGLIVGEILN